MLEDQPRYPSIEELLSFVDNPNRTACFALLNDNRSLFEQTRGSTYNHQTWEGGYLDHITEVMNLILIQHDMLNTLRPLPFNLSDTLVAGYLHDLEKPWKHEVKSDGSIGYRIELADKSLHHAFKIQKAQQYGIVVTPEIDNAIHYAEGEVHDYSSKERRMGPMASLVHTADVLSARLWFDFPAAENDPWQGASRTVSDL